MIQDWLDGTVLMVGIHEPGGHHQDTRDQVRPLLESLTPNTVAEGRVVGHVLRVKDLFVDCDRDTILVKAEPVGPTCHTGERACFSRMTEQGRPSEEDAGMPAAAFWNVCIRRSCSGKPILSRIHTSRNCCRAELTGF